MDRMDHELTDFRGGLRAAARPLRFGTIRDREIIDSELRLLAAVRRTIRDEGGPMTTTAPMDELLDERLAHRGRAGDDAAVESLALLHTPWRDRRRKSKSYVPGTLGTADGVRAHRPAARGRPRAAASRELRSLRNGNG